jgi:hypothetical protein
VKLPVGSYRCADCATEFEAPLLAEFTYGEFLLWSGAGRMAYVNAIEDGVFAEVAELFRSEAPAEPDLNDSARAMQRFFGEVASDPDPDGAPYEIGGFPPCPSCKGARMAAWGPARPTKICEIEPDLLTHARWNSMSRSQKADAVRRARASARGGTAGR